MRDEIFACEFWYVIRALDNFNKEVEFSEALEIFKKIPTAKRLLPSRISYNENDTPTPSPKQCPHRCKFVAFDSCVPLHTVWLCDDSEAFKYAQTEYTVPDNIDGLDITCFNDLVDTYFLRYESMRKGL